MELVVIVSLEENELILDHYFFNLLLLRVAVIPKVLADIDNGGLSALVCMN